MASEVLSKPLSIAMNNSITLSTFPDRAKVATVVPIDKKIDNLRPVSSLNCYSKICENYINNHIVNSMSNYISPYFSAYRKGYNSQHVRIRFLEEWRQHLDNSIVVGGVFMDLSKAFDCVLHDLLIAKLAAYFANENMLIYLYSYPPKRKQCVRIKMEFPKSYFWGTSRVHCRPYIFNCFFMISFISSINLVYIILLMITF